jgi:cytochrome b subunit of formate dehydrogenase
VAHISPNDALSILHRLIHWVSWLAFVLLQVALVALFLLAAWYFEIDKNTVLSQARSLTTNLGLQEAWQILSFFGVSGGALLAIYVWLWRKAYFAFLIPYLFRNIDARASKET